MPTVIERIQHGWDAFMNKDPTMFRQNLGGSSYIRPDRPRLTRGNEKSLVTAVINKIAIDCAQVDIKHVQCDGNGRYLFDRDSGLEECLTLSANIDQSGRAFRQDVIMSMMDEGVVAIVPTNTNNDIRTSTSFDIGTMRTAKIINWYPQHVRVRIYNEYTGRHEEQVYPKKSVCIIENPLFAVMNEPNSTLKRLMHKLALLDYVDEQQGAGKLDLIIQLPYTIKTEARRQMAEKRRKDIEMQLSESKYGIAYTDGTEHITQLNRSVENQLLTQVNDLTSMLYSQLGITKEIMEGTADESVMNNYYNRTIEPILSAVVDEMRRKFLTKTARSQGQDIKYFRDPFKLVPTTQLAELADKFTRNEIMTSNEFRQVVGMKPSADPHADELRNANISAAKDEQRVDINGNVIDPGTAEGNMPEQY